MDDNTLCRCGLRPFTLRCSEEGLTALRPTGVLFSLDIRLADDAAVFAKLLANVCAKIRAAPADREQSLRRELELHLRGVSCYGSDVLLTHVIPGRAPISGLPEIGTCMSKSAKADLEWG